MDYNTHRPATSRLGRMCCGFTRGRRLALAITSRIANKRFVYGFVTTSLISSKLVHIHAHKEAIPPDLLHRWFYTFFGQEMFLLFIFRLLLDGWLYATPRGWIRAFFGFLSTLLICLTTSLSVIAVSFYVAAGAEVHWSNIGFAGDAAGRALLLSGIVVLLVTIAVLLGIAWLAQNFIFVVSSLAVDIVTLPFTYLRGRKNYDLLPSREQSKYLDYDDDKAGAEDETDNRKQEFLTYFKVDKKSWGWVFWRVSYALFIFAVVAQIFMYYNRPLDGSLIFMSWTSVCLPFIDLKSSSPNLGAITPVYNVGIGRTWDYRSAIGDPVPLPWLPKDSVPMGFEDWYVDGKARYSAANDPLRISNRDNDLLPQLLNINLEDVKIRHVVLLLLESTRKDVFPVKKDGLIWNRFKKTFDKEEMPEEVVERLRTLTPTANWLTGDYDDGFHLNATHKKGRGGINFNDAYTPASYTLKAITASHCGVTPVCADFNIEHEHNLYQPCLPQIFEALNRIDENDSDNFTSYKWDSSFMQSVTLDYDKFDRLMPALGFPQKNIIAKDYLKTDAAKFGKVDLPDINYFGMAEVCLEDYIRDAFVRAKKDNGRVFLSHITSTSHHPYTMPDEEKYVPLGNGLDDMSHYVNAVGYDDRWLQTVLDVIKEQEVDDETLIVALGDHGLSLPENDKPPCYYNPNIGCSHIPLLFSHPKLPSFDVNDSVTSVQVLPTILDLLLETGSLSESSARAVRDLVGMYEGQSLIRQINKESTVKDVDGEQTHVDWQFTIINPGRAMVGVRDVRHKNRRLVVPVIENIEWQFTDLDKDPRMIEPVLGFEYAAFVKAVEQKYGLEVAHWAEEAAFAARWWVEENNKRWHYGPYKD